MIQPMSVLLILNRLAATGSGPGAQRCWQTYQTHMKGVDPMDLPDDWRLPCQVTDPGNGGAESHVHYHMACKHIFIFAGSKGEGLTTL